ncbi:30S ribosome-binding factor RbfA [Arthrobacter mobilis]|uniref:Ribosome-binding factor A n=1 Tax=Arthrobacter mobilis TaxID=2724944 RepID=A0A7X6HH12_9MICC|nr:30S ribosome-binding factor RbfA [Arthrobacter mobilis]NKX56069.1 30S ribosome-binding factor RbfA [Arthrobacter mobilis]
MADPARAARLAQRIKVVVAQALGKRVKDPRVDSITITDARVTNDLQHATVYYTVYGDDEAQQGARAALEKAKGVLRSEVGRNITARLTPTLEFVPDEVPVNAGQIEELLRKARARDAEVAALAQGAAFAGEADPYKNAESGEDYEEADDDDSLPGEGGEHAGDPGDGGDADQRR